MILKGGKISQKWVKIGKIAIFGIWGGGLDPKMGVFVPIWLDVVGSAEEFDLPRAGGEAFDHPVDLVGFVAGGANLFGVKKGDFGGGSRVGWGGGNGGVREAVLG